MPLRTPTAWVSWQVAHCQNLALRTKRIGNFAQALADTALPGVKCRHRLRGFVPRLHSYYGRV